MIFWQPIWIVIEISDYHRSRAVDILTRTGHQVMSKAYHKVTLEPVEDVVK